MVTQGNGLHRFRFRRVLLYYIYISLQIMITRTIRMRLYIISLSLPWFQRLISWYARAYSLSRKSLNRLVILMPCSASCHPLPAHHLVYKFSKIKKIRHALNGHFSPFWINSELLTINGISFSILKNVV